MTIWASHTKGHVHRRTTCGRGLVTKLRAGAYVCKVDGEDLKRPRGRKPVKFTTLRAAKAAVEEVLETGSFKPPVLKERIYKTYDPETEGYGNPEQWRAVFASLFAPMQDDEPYGVLEVSPTSTWAEIKKAYRRKARETHPDHGGTQEDFCRVREAFEVLAARREAA